MAQLGVLCFVAHMVLRGASARSPNPGCGSNSSYQPGLHELLKVRPAGSSPDSRRFSLYVPQAAPPGKPLPVLLLTPGNENDPHQFLKFPDLLSFAEQSPFLLVELIGEHNQFNVELNSADSPDRPDDVAYTKSVLREVSQSLCIDRRRVFCAGMSRGARFCVRLASELSDIIAALGIVSGLRYPQPNNATRPMPVIAFHGTADTIDPYEGGGYPYWGSATVPQELARWGAFNGCKTKTAARVSGTPGVRMEIFSACTDRADAILYTIEGAEHSSPGTPLLYGPKTDLLNVTSLMWHFLSKHPMRRTSLHGWDRLFSADTSVALLPHAGHHSPAALATFTVPLLMALGLLVWSLPRRLSCFAQRCLAIAEVQQELGPLL
mmetsp:Transcript_45736/g.132443  ORF Transcript_45736/g.132443 Transcript_45736/m.132443 type:complete len:379 (-) Transcript_45736:51-1187(-)